jgi:hypothetical protein
MFTLTLRAVAAFLLACGAWGVTGTPAALAAEESPLSPETIIEKNFEGKATVEFTVAEVYLWPTSWAVSSDRHWEAVLLQVVAKDTATTGRLRVLVSGEVTARLRQLGVEEPAAHFRGKVLRVSGTVVRGQRRDGPEYCILVSSLEQVEAIRKP